MGDHQQLLCDPGGICTLRKHFYHRFESHVRVGAGCSLRATELLLKSCLQEQRTSEPSDVPCLRHARSILRPHGGRQAPQCIISKLPRYATLRNMCTKRPCPAASITPSKQAASCVHLTRNGLIEVGDISYCSQEHLLPAEQKLTRRPTSVQPIVSSWITPM